MGGEVKSEGAQENATHNTSRHAQQLPISFSISFFLHFTSLRTVSAPEPLHEPKDGASVQRVVSLSLGLVPPHFTHIAACSSLIIFQTNRAAIVENNLAASVMYVVRMDRSNDGETMGSEQAGARALLLLAAAAGSGCLESRRFRVDNSFEQLVCPLFEQRVSKLLADLACLGCVGHHPRVRRVQLHGSVHAHHAAPHVH